VRRVSASSVCGSSVCGSSVCGSSVCGSSVSRHTALLVLLSWPRLFVTVTVTVVELWTGKRGVMQLR